MWVFPNSHNKHYNKRTLFSFLPTSSHGKEKSPKIQAPPESIENVAMGLSALNKVLSMLQELV
jgi:hypothetical protein